MKKLILSLLAVGALALGSLASTPTAAQAAGAAPTEAAAAAEKKADAPADAAKPEAAVPVEEKKEEVKPVVDKGDVAWMLISTILVVAMIPGLALFYGGMVRAKNMLSVLMQVLVVFSLVVVLWYVYGYSWAFTGTSAFVGGFEKLFLSGVTLESLVDTFSDEFKLPEYVFVAFQATFAGLTCALIVGAFAERIKFSAVLIFTVIWFTLAYAPIAHMVWGAGGYLLEKGALDFAGGTVVHINAGVAGLVGAYLVGKRVGYGKEAMPPHNLPLTMFGAALLWVGWFGFNAGSNLEANATTALVALNTMLATSAAIVSWTVAEWMLKGKPSMLGAASGAISGLVAITPACGSVGPGGAVVIGLLAGAICLWGVNGLKRMLGADDSLDVFGVHGVGGMLGAILTGVFAAPYLGGTGADDFAMGWQVLIQAEGVIITIIVSAIAAVIAFKIADAIVGLRVAEEEEREGLDTTSHGESAYKI